MWARVVLLTLSLVFAGVACFEDGATTPSEITGVVTKVESTGLTEVQSFTVRQDEAVYEVLIDPDTELGFPPAHLNEHRISGEPVRVEIDNRSGDLYAVSVDDA